MLAERGTTEVRTEFIPSFEVPILIAPVADTGGADLDMKAFAEGTADQTIKTIAPMLDAYYRWITTLEAASNTPTIRQNDQLRESAISNIANCRACAKRMRAGLELLKSDALVLAAFKFANHAMWDQRIHSIWASKNRKKGDLDGSPNDHDNADNRTWRPFQIAFILLNLSGISEDSSEDRKLVDLLWFPTGGGKTEAYLGLSAFVLGLRRLRGDRDGMHAGAGVSIIMRYTLRLLTVQQFQRAAALIAACELLRRREPARWGKEPFRIGVWVGRSSTPNTFADSRKALEDIREGRTLREGSPVQLLSCPRCGLALVSDKGAPKKDTYLPDPTRLRTLIFCPNHECDFSKTASANEGLPVVVVDDEIYRTCPSLIVATVDKFARMPFRGEVRSLFGLRDRHSQTYGHLTSAHGNEIEKKKIRDAVPAARLLPPELIIQDELHLISGPLGTMVGLYETAVDQVTSHSRGGVVVGPKIIASTATIRRAAQQVRQLYARDLAIFPPSGLSANDSFFAKERQINKSDDSSAGRLYVGLNAPGSSTKTLLVRTYSALLAAGQAELASSGAAADPYGTLVGYFNSLRALGGAKRLVEDDVKLVRLKYLNKQHGFPVRSIEEPKELTSRINSARIPELLKELDHTFPFVKGALRPVDVLLATNMISVGVDIDRLGLMVVTGQPKTTAEYIQATSRVGRKYPGLVVTMYNWMGARDLSHYERFRSYHSALYRHVEAISVTPFSSRALDRGLRGVFAAINRLVGDSMSNEEEAGNFDRVPEGTRKIISAIVARASRLVGDERGAGSRTPRRRPRRMGALGRESAPIFVEQRIAKAARERSRFT